MPLAPAMTGASRSTTNILNGLRRSLPSSIGVRSSTIACWLITATMTRPIVIRGMPLSSIRMSPSAYMRGHTQAMFYTLHYLAFLKEIGANVLNGYDAYVYEFSKARQLGLLHQLELPYPRPRDQPSVTGTDRGRGPDLSSDPKAQHWRQRGEDRRSRPQRNCDRRRQAVTWTWGSTHRARAGVLTGGGQQHCPRGDPGR